MISSRIVMMALWMMLSAPLSYRPVLAEDSSDSNEGMESVDWNLSLPIAEAFRERRSRRLNLVPHPPAPPRVTAETYNAIDHFIVRKWAEHELTEAISPPPVCDDATFARRAYFDVIGVPPTIAELDWFLGDTSVEKRQKLVNELLARDDEYAAHATTFWEDALASCPQNSFGSVLTRGDYRDWIYESLRQNKPYDQFVAEIIDPKQPGYKQPIDLPILGVHYQIGFVRDRDQKEVLQTAADVGQVFLATSMKCAGCHDHFNNVAWTQQRFLGFAGYFAAFDLEHVRCEVHLGETIAARWPFPHQSDDPDLPNDQEERLHRAAALLTDPMNPRFAKAIANRLWKQFLGTGLVEPVDDFREDTEPSHPELLDWLAYDLMEHGFDLKHTIRRLLGSRTYQLAYNPRLADVVDTSAPEQPRYFRSPGLRRLSAEQIVDGIQLAVGQTLKDEDRVYRRCHSKSNTLTRALGRNEARAEVNTERLTEATIMQALELMNGAPMNELVGWGALVDQSSDAQDLELAVDRIYRAILSRAASEEERALGAAFIMNCRSSLENRKAKARPDIVLADFEQPGFTGWTVEGEAFSKPVRKPFPPYLAALAVEGEGIAFSQSPEEAYTPKLDEPIGTLTSDSFAVDRDYLQFLVFGGGLQDQTCVNLIVDGAVVASATGQNDFTARRHQFDLKEYSGSTAQVQVVDEYGSGFGNIGVDHLVLSDVPIAFGSNPPSDSQPVSDLLWALFTSPAYQFLR